MSLINDALKRASEAQAQAAQRPRGPKGVEDLPVPMTPVATRERPAWLPVAGISVLVIALLGASGFFFSKWWKERQAWQPYAETPEDDDGTNAVPKAISPPVQVAKKTDPVTPPPPKVATPPTPAPTNPPAPVAVVTPVPPPVPAATNPVVVAAPAMTNPPPVVVVPVPVPPPAATNPPPVTPPVVVAMTPTNPPPPVVIPPATTPADTAKKTEDPPVKVASAEFPEIKLQGIIRAKKKVSAVVNGKTLSPGDRIEGAFLLKIDTESVTFEKGSVRREFFLLR